MVGFAAVVGLEVDAEVGAGFYTVDEAVVVGLVVVVDVVGFVVFTVGEGLLAVVDAAGLVVEVVVGAGLLVVAGLAVLEDGFAVVVVGFAVVVVAGLVVVGFAAVDPVLTVVVLTVEVGFFTFPAPLSSLVFYSSGLSSIPSSSSSISSPPSSSSTTCSLFSAFYSS